MSTQPFTDHRSFTGFFLTLGGVDDLAEAGKWRRSDRIFFCAASAILCWMMVLRVAELLILG